MTRSLCPVDDNDWFRVAVGDDTAITVKVTSANAEEMANIWLHVQVGGSAFSVTSLSNLDQPYLINEVIEVDGDQDAIMRIESWGSAWDQLPLDAYTLTVTACEPQCVDVACGDDGCGGSCGTCTDANACTSDLCVEGSCAFVDLGCDDEDPCTVDMCMDGECIHEPLDCDDGDPRTIDGCDSGTCVAEPFTCDDGDPCTQDICAEGLSDSARCHPELRRV